VLEKSGGFLHGADDALKIQIQMTWYVPAVRADMVVERPLGGSQRHSLVVSCNQTAASLSASLATALSIPSKYQQLWVMRGAGTSGGAYLVSPRKTLRSGWEHQNLAHAGVYDFFLRDTRQTLSRAASSSSSSSSSVLVLVRWLDVASLSWRSIGSGEFSPNIAMEDILVPLVLAHSDVAQNYVVARAENPKEPLAAKDSPSSLSMTHGQELLIYPATYSASLPPAETQQPIEWSRFGTIEADLVHCERCQTTFDDIEDIRDDLMDDDMPCNNLQCPHHHTHASESRHHGGADGLRDRLQTARLCRRRDKLVDQLEELETNLVNKHIARVSVHDDAATNPAPALTLAAEEDVLAKKRAKRLRQKQARQPTITTTANQEKPAAEATVAQNNDVSQLEPEIGRDSSDLDSDPDPDPDSSSSSVASELDDDTFFDRIAPKIPSPSPSSSPTPPPPPPSPSPSSAIAKTRIQPPPMVERVAGFMGVFDAEVLDEIRQRALVGVSLSFEKTLLALEPGSPIFCFEPKTRMLHGPFFTLGAAGRNLQPRAFPTLSGTRSRFPVQVRIRYDDNEKDNNTRAVHESQWKQLVRGPQRIRPLRSFECARLIKQLATLLPLAVDPIVDDSTEEEEEAAQEAECTQQFDVDMPFDKEAEEESTGHLATFVPLPFDLPLSFLDWTLPASSLDRSDILAFLLGTFAESPAHRIWAQLALDAPSNLKPTELVDACKQMTGCPPYNLSFEEAQYIAQAEAEEEVLFLPSKTWSLFSHDQDES